MAKEENVTIQEMQAELKYAMPCHTGFVNGIIADWDCIIEKIKTDSKKEYIKASNDLKDTLEVLVFNSSGQSSIYEQCDKYYRFRFDDIPISFEERFERIEELNSARKEYEMCKSGAIYLGDISEAM